jgi:hypothetical protein
MIPHYKLSSYLAVKVISKFESKGRCTYEMMIAKAEWKVVGDVRAKLSLVVSLGISTLLSEGHYSSQLGPRPCPSGHNQGPSWPEKARLLSGVCLTCDFNHSGNG